MKALVVDTSVVSYLLKNHTLALEYRPLLAHKLLCLSFMTVAELYRWPLQRGWGEATLLEHLRAYLVLPHDVQDFVGIEGLPLVSIRAT